MLIYFRCTVDVNVIVTKAAISKKPHFVTRIRVFILFISVSKIPTVKAIAVWFHYQ